VQMTQKGWGRGTGKVHVEVGVDFAFNPLSKRYSGYEVREVGVVQQPYVLVRDFHARTAQRNPIARE
jgi:hypothetical protein